MTTGSAAPEPPRPGRIGQIAIHVADVERATTFYRDVLGLEHLFSAPPGLSFFRCGEVRLMLARPEGSERVPPASILYYAVEDVEAAHRALAAKGAEVTSEPSVIHRTESTELWMAFYGDGEGNTFAVMSEVPIAAGGP
jgi:methylmalonyl-CoA/ethylmalonyl-CoA epimerase